MKSCLQETPPSQGQRGRWGMAGTARAVTGREKGRSCRSIRCLCSNYRQQSLRSHLADQMSSWVKLNRCEYWLNLHYLQWELRHSPDMGRQLGKCFIRWPTSPCVLLKSASTREGRTGFQYPCRAYAKPRIWKFEFWLLFKKQCSKKFAILLCKLYFKPDFRSKLVVWVAPSKFPSSSPNLWAHF